MFNNLMAELSTRSFQIQAPVLKKKRFESIKDLIYIAKLNQSYYETKTGNSDNEWGSKTYI